MSPVDLSAALYAQYQRARKRAEAAIRSGAQQEAATAYLQAATLMRRYATQASSAEIRKKRLERAEALEALADRLQNLSASAGKALPSTRLQAAESTGEDDYESQVLGLITHTNISWEDIGGLDDTKRAIKSAYGLALARKPRGVKLESWRTFLLYGPPGTGKTLLAAATAGNLEATFFNVSVSSLLSKYFGESTRLISALYTVAGRLSPSVVFMDEFESLTPPRGSGESGAERRIVSALLAELDGLKSKDTEDLVITIGSTNYPWLIDDAILSRFQKRIYVPLPDAKSREVILDIHLTRRGFKSQVPMDELVRRTAGYSGREIERLCQTAITRMTQRANPGLIQAVDQGRKAVEDFHIKIRPLSASDFEAAFAEVQPQTDPDLLAQYECWKRHKIGD